MDKILENGPISKAFGERGIFTFREACEWVRSLAYKRNTTKDDALIVLKESCGTCSSKHELIKRLAEENGIESCQLVLCMFKMSATNTPKVGPVLSHYGVEYIPEAHTYITINNEVHDLTFPENPELLYQKDILFTECISSEQIRDYKAKKHRAYLREWRDKDNVPFTIEELWMIREECIALLAD